MLAAHIDNWLFFVFVAVAMLFRILGSAATKTKTRSDDEDETWRSTPPPPLPRNQPQRGDADAEKVRKFLEALGQPSSSPPPPPVVPRTDVAPRPLAPVSPPLTTYPRRRQAPPPVPKITLPEQAGTPLPQRIFTPRVTQTTFEVQEGPTATELARVRKPETVGQPKQEIAAETNLVALLRSPSGLRNAIILREIFGPPRSLQSLEIGNL